MTAFVHDPAVMLAAHAAFALLFAAAAWHKLRDRVGFAAVLSAYRVLPAAVVPAAALAVAIVELGAAAAWLVPRARVGALMLTVGLLATYGVAIAVNLARGRRAIDCGCGVGSARQPIGEGLLVRNALLAAVAVAAAAPSGERPLVWVDALTVAGVLAVAACGWTAAHDLAAAAARVAAVDERRARRLGAVP